MTITHTVVPSPPAAPTSLASGRSDRFLGRMLLAFFLALYLLTGSGHGYSPDGEFAFLFARSLILDPQHEYLKGAVSRVSHWGFMVSVLAQPLVLLGEPLAGAMPQKDSVTVDGHDYVLGYYRPPGRADDGPTVELVPAGDEYRRVDLPAGRHTSLAVVSFLTEAGHVPQGTAVAEISLVGASGERRVFPFRAGIETAQWDQGEAAQHRVARVASVWSGNSVGRNYFTELPFGDGLELKELRIRYLVPEGRLYVRSLALLDRDTGGFHLLPSEQRYWSDRENHNFFVRLFYSPYNAVVTALACLLVFALARLLGYRQSVSVAATLVYGVGTLAWPYSKYDFSEPTLAMFVLLTLYLVLRWDLECRSGRELEDVEAPRASAGDGRIKPRLSCPTGVEAPAGRPRAADRLLVVAGVAMLLATGTKYAAGVVMPLVLLQIVALHWARRPSVKELPGALKPALLFSAPFLIVAAPALWYLSSRFGYRPTVFELWAGIQDGWFALPMGIGLQGLLFSPGRSFFLYSPPTILALFSVVAFVRRHGARTVAMAAIVLFYFGPAYSMKVAWHAGAGWGPRYQVLVIPLVILMAAPLIEWAIEGGRRWARHVLLATFVLGVGLQLLAVSKSFDLYLGLFKYEIVGQLPDQGAGYGGADYYPYSAGLDDGNAITATLWAWPFSPILAQAWLLSGDLLTAGPAALQPAREALLSNPPWKLWGIGVRPAHPEFGLGTDFWSMRLKTDFPSSPVLLGAVYLTLLLLESVVVGTGAGLVAAVSGRSKRRRAAVRAWIALSVVAFLLFDLAHLV